GAAATEVAPLYPGAYVGGFGTAPGLKKPSVNQYINVLTKWYPSIAPAAPSGFVYNYYNAAWALIRGLATSADGTGGQVQASMPRTNASAYQISNKGLVKLDSRRQAIQDQFQLRIGAKGVPSVIGFVPNVDQTFSGVFRPNKPAPGRNFPPCVKRKL